ncbi:MAG: hypothetical protein M3R62_01065 [Acidobacteriota bacterium]|nr:hypothetical protein [Acidobacteriota bacterium]
MPDSEAQERLRLLETEIERRLSERFAALRDEFDRMRLETDRRWYGFLERFDQDLKGVVPGELLGTDGARTSAPSPGLMSVGAVRALDQAGTQVDVLHRYLDECRRHCSRAALLVARGGSIGAWKAIGFSAHGGDDDAVRHVAMPLPAGGLLSRVMSGTALRLPSPNEISTLLRASKVADVVMIPMVVREKISGALYADAVLGEEERFDPEALGLLTFLAGLVVDRLAARKLKPAPALRETELIQKSEPAGMWMDEGRAAVEAAAPPQQDAPEIEPEPEPSLDYDEPAPAPAAEASALELRPAPASPLRLSDPLAAEAAAEPGRKLAGPLALSMGDERHEEARRFARLLVSEIKLYNERAVVEGREGGNIYQRLREDIDRSRQMYNDRIPEDVRNASNFFHKELVRVLADGRPEALGL